VDAHRQQVDDLARQAGRALEHSLVLRRSALSSLEARLAALSPLATLERGYAIVRRADTGVVVRRVAQTQAGDTLMIRVQDGEFGAVRSDQ
jgi:exodeoxyribonuclease VII large subunit